MIMNLTSSISPEDASLRRCVETIAYDLNLDDDFNVLIIDAADQTEITLQFENQAFLVLIRRIP